MVNLQRQKEIEKFLIKQTRRSANVYEIAKYLKIHWMTAERELQRMEKECRVHSEKMSGSKVYFLNGKGNWQDDIRINKNHTLYLDTLISPFGERYIRVKENKYKDGNWQTMGNIILSPNEIREFVGKLSIIGEKIEQTENRERRL